MSNIDRNQTASTLERTVHGYPLLTILRQRKHHLHIINRYPDEENVLNNVYIQILDAELRRRGYDPDLFSTVYDDNRQKGRVLTASELRSVGGAAGGRRRRKRKTRRHRRYRRKSRRHK